LLHCNGAVSLAVRQIDPRLSAGELCLCRAQLDIVGRRIDDKQQITLVDDISVLKADLGQRAADLRPKLDLIDGRVLAQKLKPRSDVLLERRADGDGWRSHGCGLHGGR
jgi:hypothetical protein